MSVLIRGMEMPQCCGECKFMVDRWCYASEDAYFVLNKRHPDCPLVEVPTPHGRLIDASQFEVIGYDAIEGSFDEGVTFVLNRIDDAPTVIEEEE